MKQRDRLTITLRKNILQRLDATIDGREIRNRSHAIEKILSDAFGDAPVKKAIILGGGGGVLHKGKATSPLLVLHEGRALIDWHIEKLKSIGVEEFILSLGPLRSDVEDYVGDGARYDVVISYVNGDDDGTATALRHAQPRIHDTFIVMNGHVMLHDIDLVDMILFHKDRNATLTMAVTTVVDPSGLGQVHMRGAYITDFSDKSNEVVFDEPSHMVNAGLYIIEPELCDIVTDEDQMIERDIVPRLIASHDVCGYVIDVPWSRVKNNR